MPKKLLFLLLISTQVFAQAQRPINNPLGLPNNQNIAPPMPNTGLGQQVNVIATPKSANIRTKVKKVLKDFEDSQLTPSEVKKLKSLNLKNSQLGISPYNNLPKPVTRTLMVDLSPGVGAPVLRLSAGQLTSLVFSSLNGDPWYIESVKLNRTLFSDGQDNQTATNVLTIESLKPAAYGNVTIMLKGLSTPVIFSINANQQKEVDFRVDVKIPGRNPDAVSRINYADKIPSLDDTIPYFLDGVPPQNAKRLKTTNSLEAWEYNNNMYIRTNADVQYPAYYSSARSTSGIAVYRFNQVYNSITLLQGGRAQTISIEQY